MATKKAAKKSSKKAAKKATGGARGRASQYAGKKISKLVNDNPRREGTHGHKSFAIIKNGMTYEQYIAAGGRSIDLDWDVKRKHLKIAA